MNIKELLLIILIVLAIIASLIWIAGELDVNTDDDTPDGAIVLTL